MQVYYKGGMLICIDKVGRNVRLLARMRFGMIMMMVTMMMMVMVMMMMCLCLVSYDVAFSVWMCLCV